MQVNCESGTCDVKQKDLIGRKIRAVRALTNYNIRVPIGWEGIIESVWRRTVHVKGDPCDSCGVAVYMRQVPLSALVLLEAADVKG